jgi:hypothetical protein
MDFVNRVYMKKTRLFGRVSFCLYVINWTGGLILVFQPAGNTLQHQANAQQSQSQVAKGCLAGV